MKFLTPIDLNANELQNAVVQILASDPASPVNGQLWVNSTSWVLKVRLNAVTISLGRVDQTSAPTASVSLNSQKITNLLDPTSDQDAATRAWVLSQINPKVWKEPVRAASTADVSIVSAPAAIDGVTLAANDRVLLKNQTTGSQNGLYLFTAAAAALTRTTDADVSAEVSPGLTVFINEGTVNADKRYFISTNGPITLGTTTLVFTLDSGAGTVNKYSATIGDAATTQITVTHNLGSEAVDVSVRYTAGTKEVVFCDWRTTGSNSIRVDFAVAPASAEFTVTVMS